MASQRVGAPADRIRQAILLVRGQRVMLDADLAALYDVPTGALVQPFSEIFLGFLKTSCFD
jgi:hypothetical protein